MDWAKQTYNEQYEKWMPWVEDLYLRWFTKDNKTSYATKQNLDKAKVTGIQQVDTLQDGVHNLVAGQVGQGGLLQPIGDLVSREGVNRAERKGKDDRGGYLPGVSSVPGSGAIQSGGGAIKSAGGYVGGMFGGGNKAAEQQRDPQDQRQA